MEPDRPTQLYQMIKDYLGTSQLAVKSSDYRIGIRCLAMVEDLSLELREWLTDNPLE